MNTAPNYEEAYEQMSDTNDPLWPFVVQSSGTGEPVVSMPRKQPITSELLEVLGLALEENDRLRAELVYPRLTERRYSAEDRRRGRALCTVATFEGDTLVVGRES